MAELVRSAGSGQRLRQILRKRTERSAVPPRGARPAGLGPALTHGQAEQGRQQARRAMAAPSGARTTSPRSMMTSPSLASRAAGASSPSLPFPTRVELQERPCSTAQMGGGGGGVGGGGGRQVAMSPAPGGGKRGRGAEEDVYVDNLHSHKRYLTEIMASSMNGLSVGDSVADNIVISPVRDEMITQCSPMSEESDDYRYYDTQLNTSGSQTDATSSPSTSPISSPHRFQKPHTWFSCANPYPFPSCSLSAVVCSQGRRGSGTEHEGRIPSSPNDMCHGGDLRRTALLRSVQMRVQSPHPCDLLSSSGHEQEKEHGHAHADDLDHDQKQALGVQLDQRSCSCPESIQDTEYQSPANCGQRLDHDVDFVEDQITV